MCGIFGSLTNKPITYKQLDILFKGASDRGKSGTGLTVFALNKKIKDILNIKYYGSWDDTEVRLLVKQEYELFTNVNWDADYFVILGQQRQRPETEIETDKINYKKTVQPILNEKYNFALVHNGAISNNICEKYKDWKHVSRLDSETIGLSFFNHDEKLNKVCTELVGGFASLLFSWRKKISFNIMVSHNPLSYYKDNDDWFFHSNKETLCELYKQKHYYYNNVFMSLEDMLIPIQKIKPYTYYSLQYINSMFGSTKRFLTNKIQGYGEFTPNYYHPVYEDIKNKELETSDKELVLISASGGLDSSSTAYILKKLGYDIKLVHFNLNQRSEEAELDAIRKFAEKTNMNLQEIEIGGLFKEIDKASMISKDSKTNVISGNYDIIKTSSTWQANRNTIFYSILVAIAETEITTKNYKNVYIAGGFANLTESLTFPDNSEPWADAMINSTRVGSIHGTRIKQLNVLRNCTKTEEVKLVDKLGMPHWLTCSCDNAKTDENGNFQLCINCQSTSLSRLAFKIAGVRDERPFYDDGSGNGKHWLELLETLEKSKSLHLNEIIDKLNLPNDAHDKKMLKSIVGV
jgi:7-cyano-7-deazaguanine synthase